LTGSIVARDLVILRTARIDGDVSYDALTIEQGAQVNGRFSPRGPQLAAVAGEEQHLILATSHPAG
jgi:cytoskeletal protein CcmA (bactofilin family)